MRDKQTTSSVDADGGVKLTGVTVVDPGDETKPSPPMDGKSDEPPTADGEDIDGALDRAKTGAKERSMKQDFYRILHESKGQKGRLFIGVWFLLLTAICNMLVPYYAGRMTDAISLTLQDRAGDARREANEALFGLLTVGLVGGVFQAARSYLFNTASYKVVARLRNRLFSNILRQEIGFSTASPAGLSSPASPPTPLC